MLQHFWSGQGAVFGDVPNENQHRVGELGVANQIGRALAHLRDTTGRRLHIFMTHHLDRIHD